MSVHAQDTSCIKMADISTDLSCLLMMEIPSSLRQATVILMCSSLEGQKYRTMRSAHSARPPVPTNNTLHSPAHNTR